MIEYSKNVSDTNSVLYRILEANKADPKQIVADLYMFLLGATDTTPSAILAIITLLHWKPEEFWKLKAEIDKVIPDDFDLTNLTNEVIESVDYLSYFIKEILRYDAPLSSNSNQVALEDIDLGDIVIKKGTDIWWNIFGAHYNPH